MEKRNDGECTVSANHEVPSPVQQDPPTADEVTVAATSTHMEKKARLTSVRHRGHVGCMSQWLIRKLWRLGRLKFSARACLRCSTASCCRISAPTCAAKTWWKWQWQWRGWRWDHDLDYDPLDQSEDVEDYHHDSYTLRSDAPPEEEYQFLVSESCLASILGKSDMWRAMWASCAVYLRDHGGICFHLHK